MHIARRLGADERERTGGCFHFVGRRDVVLEQNRNPVERTANFSRLALGVELVGGRERSGV